MGEGQRADMAGRGAEDGATDEQRRYFSAGRPVMHSRVVWTHDVDGKSCSIEKKEKTGIPSYFITLLFFSFLFPLIHV